MLDPVMNVWDCAPLLPILEEAGGTFTDWRWQRTIRGGNAVSTNGLVAGEVREIIEGSFAEDDVSQTKGRRR
jgi:fructose-1,6-bisphosphatase/inositol monophosphatase family enzyme